MRRELIMCPLCKVEMKEIIVDKKIYEDGNSVHIKRIPGHRCPQCGQSWFSYTRKERRDWQH